jgi:hypothetical protein
VKDAKPAYCLPLNSLFDVAMVPPFPTQPLTAPCGPNSPRTLHRRAQKNDTLFNWKNNPRSPLSSEKFLVQVPTLLDIQIISIINTQTVHTNFTSLYPQSILNISVPRKLVYTITSLVQLKNTRPRCLQIPTNASTRSFELRKRRSRAGPNLERQGTRFANTTKMCTEAAISKQILSFVRSVMKSSERHTEKIRVSRHREVMSSTLFQGLISQRVLPPEPGFHLRSQLSE